MNGDVTAVSVTVNEWVLGPASLIRANTAASDHLLHISAHNSREISSTKCTARLKC